MFHLSLLFILLVLVAMLIVLFFTTLKAILKFIIKFILKHRGKPCPFCKSEYSVITEKTNEYHKQVCKKCGFSVMIDDTNSQSENYSNDEPSNTDDLEKSEKDI